jgi:hypothetical protein
VVKGIRLSELLFGLAVLSIFFPFKIYPLFFVIGAVFFFTEHRKTGFPLWAIFLSIFTLYAISSLFLQHAYVVFPWREVAKMCVNFVFLFFATTWLAGRDNRRLISLLDSIFHLIFLLVFIQLLLYHEAYDFRLIFGSSSSGEASALYNKDLYFWGLADKNMFGARIALLGFAYILLPVLQRNKIAWWRITFIFILAYLSLSRTPIVALLLGCGGLLWFSASRPWRIAMLALAAVALPFVLFEVLRVDTITASNDGMGVRLVYWKAFFQHFNVIPIWGVGFMGAPAFLSQHAQFYHGEPHIHNTFMSAYLELGIIGFLSYILFLIFFFRVCVRHTDNLLFWFIALVPLLAIMMILYSGYDNDVVIYMLLIVLLGYYRPVRFNTLRAKLWHKKY